MAVFVVTVLRFAADAHEEQYHSVGKQVGKRMHRIGRHRSTMSHDARHKLEHRQHHIRRAAHQCHFVYLAFAVHNI